jgi:hypothetical protein
MSSLRGVRGLGSTNSDSRGRTLHGEMEAMIGSGRDCLVEEFVGIWLGLDLG